jgi:LmbE family N-acetylglucosaminyl deacetylase
MHTDDRLTADLPRRLLGVWAHPDDEAYLSAGLMGRVCDAGHHVTVVTATRGEKGTTDPHDFDQDHFGEVRERELRASLAELGVTDVRLLGHRDGETDLVPDETAIESIVAIVRDVRPDVIVTFGPDGITGHIDHRLVSRWTTEAWRRTSGGADLRYATMSDEFVQVHAELNDRFGTFADVGPDGPTSFPEDAIASTVRLDEIELARKRRALARHASQTAEIARLMGERTFTDWWRTEWFRAPTAAEIATCSIAVPV